MLPLVIKAGGTTIEDVPVTMMDEPTPIRPDGTNTIDAIGLPDTFTLPDVPAAMDTFTPPHDTFTPDAPPGGPAAVH